MKKYILYLLSFLLVFSSSFAFNIYNQNDVESQYFSINFPDVYIESSLDISNFSVNYIINSENLTKFYNFSDCENSEDFCGNFSILDLIESSNDSFSGSNSFIINVGDDSETIYLDLDKPEFNLISSELISSNSTLLLKFNYSDNNDVESVKLYSKSGSSLTFIDDLLNKTSYSYRLLDSDNLSLVFRVTDLAENSLNYEKTFSIEDIFPPKIVSTFLILNSSIYSLEFTVEDKNLSKYELISSDQILSGDLTGTIERKNVKLPFSDGYVILKVYDEFGNSINKTIELKDKFTTEFSTLYSNSKYFSFRSDADSCFLNKIDNSNENIQFSENSGSFYLTLDLDDVDEYNLNIYCEDSTQKEYYDVLFYYDTNEPSNVSLEYELDDNGEIKLFWDDAKDSESDVNYKLYRDDDRIYHGTKNYYYDSDVDWPNQYSYYLRILDEAGNYVDSNELNLVPKKVNIIYSTNLQFIQNVSNDTFNLNLKSEKDSNINLQVENSNNVIFEKNYTNVDGNEINLNLNLLEGENKVKLTFTDDYDNKIVRNYIINYNKPILVSKNDSINQEESNLVNSNVESSSKIAPINKTVVLKTIKSKTFDIGIYIWIILILLIVLYFIFYILDYDLFFKEKNKNKIKKKSSNNFEIKKSQRKSNKLNFGFLEAKKDDSKLGKSLNKIKEERIKRQIEKKLEKERRKREEEKSKKLSDLQKKKLEDISNRNKYDFKVKTNYKKRDDIEKMPSSLDLLINSILKSGDKIRNSIKKQVNKKEIKKKEKSDKFDDYLDKVKNTVSYSNSTEYLLKTEIEKQRAKAELEKAKLLEQAKLREEEAKINAEKQAKLEKKQKKELEKARIKEEKSLAKDSLDDYLMKKTKKKSFYFAEKFVNKDLLKRRK